MPRVLTEFWTDHNKIERRCTSCRQPVLVGAVAYVRQVQKETGGYGVLYANKFNRPRWQTYHETCAAMVGAPVRLSHV